MINSAAVVYNWENVAYYDFTFRQMMSECPDHSWAKLYTQMWSLAMCDPLQKGGNHYVQSQSSNSGGNLNSNASSKDHKIKDWHDCCCWRFN